MSHFNDEAPARRRQGRRRSADPGGISHRRGHFELRIHLGSFPSEAAAIQARDAALRSLHADGLLPAPPQGIDPPAYPTRPDAAAGR